MSERPSVALSPDPRWVFLVGTYEELADVARRRWPVTDSTPEWIADRLETVRVLFAHSYFRLEFLTVATEWALVTLEAALHERLDDETSSLHALIGRAEADGLLSRDEAVALNAARQLRNRFVHATEARLWTPGMVADVLDVTHRAVADLFDRESPAG